MSEPVYMSGSYPKIFQFGHRSVREILSSEVVVEEKVDGSQFSFGRFYGELRCRSKGADINIHAPDKMFARGVEAVSKLDLKDGFTYRGEYLNRPKHNVLAYERTPINHVIMFDVEAPGQNFMGPEEKALEAERIGLECVPALYRGKVESAQQLRELLDTVSVLGGQKIEGVVLKNYSMFGDDKKILIAKFVSEAFKELHKVDNNSSYRKENPTKNDIIERMASKYTAAARWDKAIQHLRDAGKLKGDPTDIAALFTEVPADILAECKEDIMEELFNWGWPLVRRKVTNGLAEHYKQRLLEASFE